MKREEPWLAPSVRRLLYSPCSRCECECSFQPLSDSKGMRTEAPLREAVRWIPGVVELEWGAGDASQPLQGILWKSHVTPRVEVTLLSNRPAGPAGHRSSQQKCMELRFSLSAQACQPPSMTPCTRPTLPPLPQPPPAAAAVALGAHGLLRAGSESTEEGARKYRESGCLSSPGGCLCPGAAGRGDNPSSRPLPGRSWCHPHFADEHTDSLRG